MSILIRAVEIFLSWSDAAQARLSGEWREHSNWTSLALIFVLGGLAIYTYTSVIRPPDTFPAGELVTVQSGESLIAIANDLERQGVIRSPIVFRALVTLFAGSRGARAGDYLFKQPKDIWSIARAISIGAYGLEPLRIRIHEGATVREMAAVYDKALPRFDAEAFLTTASPDEGYFFPDTYYFLPNATEAIVRRTMRENFDAHIEVASTTIAASPHSLADIVIMASIVEREARNPRDRRMIAGVLWNRIERRMPLQVDAAFLYTLGKGTFQLTIKDLITDAPYNTYTRKGLPPTAIGSPSIDSILAAANPIPNDYIFYLADNTGVTHYSKTYSEHLKLKKQYLGT